MTASALVQLPAATAGARVVASKSKDITRRPVIPKQQGSPPANLVRQDIIVGTGRAAREGDELAVKYIGKLWTGKVIDDAWTRPLFRFELGAQLVIDGWEQGLRGIRPGGRRQITIPPRLAYGREGQGAIPPRATLIFIVDAVRVTPHGSVGEDVRPPAGA